MQDTLGNILGGLALQLDDSIEIGDWIRLDGTGSSGKRGRDTWRYTAIDTRNGERVVIPNGQLMKSHFIGMGAQKTCARRCRRPRGAGYGSHRLRTCRRRG